MQLKTPKTGHILGISQQGAPWVLALFLAAITLFRFYYAQSIPLSEDEAYYWDWSRRLAWGYFDQGPLVAWVIRLGTSLFGNTELGVRFMAVLCSLGMSLLLYDLCRRFWRDPLMGLFMVAALNLSLLFSVGAVLMTYDTPQALFWAFTLYCTARAIFEDRRGLWYLGGISLGLALLAKYTSGLLPITILAYLATSSRHRHLLKRKEPWLASLIAGLIMLPNLYWNATHHWVSFGNTVRHASGSSFNFTLFEFLGGQAGLLGPVLFIFLLIGLVKAWRLARSGDGPMAFLLWTSLPMLVIFTVLSAQSRMQPNWPAPGYLGALPAAAAALWPSFQSSSRWRKWGAFSLALGLIMVMVSSYPSWLIRTLDISKDNNPLNKLYGWEQVNGPIAEALRDWPGPDKPFIFGVKHQMCGVAAFYGPGQPRVEEIFTGSRLSQYIFWSDPAKLKGRDALGVFEHGRKGIARYFRKVEKLKSYQLTGPWGGHLHDLVLYRCYGFLGTDKRPPEFLDTLEP